MLPVCHHDLPAGVTNAGQRVGPALVRIPVMIALGISGLHQQVVNVPGQDVRLSRYGLSSIGSPRNKKGRPTVGRPKVVRVLLFEAVIRRECKRLRGAAR